MISLGFCGGFNLAHEDPFDIPRAFTHDGAAVLVEDGEVIAAIEEERLNRIKHSNKFPTQALRFCLERRDLRLSDVDRIAFYATEEYCNMLLAKLRLGRPEISKLGDARTILRNLLRREFDCDVDQNKIVFVRHHLAHAVSAYALSGFERSLVLTIDGYGDFLSGLVGTLQDGAFSELQSIAQSNSLGLFYLDVIQFIGYGAFDEYKVMGLAPYGDPAAFLPVLQQCYSLLPEGRYELRLAQIVPALLGRIEGRAKGQPFTQAHKDLAAALQVALEQIVLHVLTHYQRVTKQTDLCLAGGVAHNCTMNGHILNSGLFERVFVQPAAHDAGCALGAALIAGEAAGFAPKKRSLSQVLWGTDIGGEREQRVELERWRDFVSIESASDITTRTAQLLADGAVIGWVQGRSEFGPRALGNRSILADPRPAANKERINMMVKKREGYRPFAPSVLEEEVRAYFDFSGKVDALPFMAVVVDVKEDKRDLLGAITHVDGTARVQTVTREANPRYWDLIAAFKGITGVPLVLNTSFNNNAEPIVDSVKDAVVTFLTTGLDYLVVGNFIVKKRPTPPDAARLGLRVELPAYVRLESVTSFVDPKRMARTSRIRTSYDPRVQVPISNDLYDVLTLLDGSAAVGTAFERAKIDHSRIGPLLEEINQLWAQRLVQLSPPELREEPRARYGNAATDAGRALEAGE